MQHRNPFTILASLVLLIPPASAGAQRSITLDAALALAMRASPDVVASRLRVDSARAEVRAAGALPNPVFQSIPNVPFQYGVTLPLDLGPQRSSRVRLQRLGFAAAGGDLEDTHRLVRFGVRQAYVDAQLAETLRRVVTDERDIVRQLLAADSVRLRAGDIAMRDVTRTELELMRAEAAVQRADAGVRATRLALQLAIGAARPDTGLAVADTLRPPDELLAPAPSAPAEVDQRADVRAAKARVGASNAGVDFARAQLLPAPQLGLVEQPSAPFMSGRHEALALTFTLPLLDQFAGQRSRAAAVLRAAEVDVERRRVRATAEIAETADSVHAAAGMVARYRAGLLARADSALAMTRYAYASGAASLAELLDAVRTHVETRAEYATAVHDYWVSAYAYRRSTGIEPDSP